MAHDMIIDRYPRTSGFSTKQVANNWNTFFYSPATNKHSDVHPGLFLFRVSYKQVLASSNHRTVYSVEQMSMLVIKM